MGAHAEPVLDQSDRFWKSPEDDIPEQMMTRRPDHPRRPSGGKFDFASFRPQYDRTTPGYFIAPSTDCIEVIVNATMTYMTLFRILLDQDGRPIRAAIYTNCPGHHDV